MNATRSRWARGDSVAKKSASKKKQKKCWSQSVGEYGFTVRVFELYPNSNLYRSIWVEGREDKKSLGHKDREKAISQAHELITHLRATEGAVEQDRITLGVLLVRYLASEAHAAKGTRARTEDERKLRRIVEYLGSSRLAVSLGAEDVRRFTRDRKAGTGKLLGVTPGNQVGDRTAEADLVALRTMLNWARGAKNAQGVQLLSANPLFGVPFPKERNPRRPLVTEDDYLLLLAAAARMNPLLQAALVVAEGTGRRLSAWRRLRWRDIRFDKEVYGAIHWPGEFDKGKRALLRPISAAVRDALLAIRPADAAPDEWVFPSPEDSRKACRRELLDDWLRDCYDAAGFQPEAGGLWHPFRRKWVTERKNYPLADIAAAGGWKDERSLKSYLHEDPETVRKVVLEPTHRLRRGAGA